VKIGTPFGEYPFVYRRVERRDGKVVVIGTVAGVESSVVFDRGDLVGVAKVLGGAVTLVLARRALQRRRARAC
jgi:hypothetical protein